MERTGIEPVTSGLQIPSSVDQGWSPRVDGYAGWLYALRLDEATRVSV